MSVDQRDFSWHAGALCAKRISQSRYFINLWFEEEETIASSIAASICFECPIRKECLKRACDNKEPAGIWGGQPFSIRSAKGKNHSYFKLVNLPDPYLTEDTDSRFHIQNL